MNQTEILQFLSWADNCGMISHTDCDESVHYYLVNSFPLEKGDEHPLMLGGWAGDHGSYFINQSDTVSKLLRLYDLWGGDQ